MALKSFIRPTKLRLKSKTELSGNVYIFDFVADEKIEWQAGQYASFEIKDSKGRTYRKTFTIASAPGESVISIATRINKEQTEQFKLSLLKLKRGGEIKMRGPTGPMHINDPSKRYALLATGVGITPFRSILKQLVLEGATNIDATLLYVGGKYGHIFKDDFSEIKSVLKNLKIEYIYKPDRITGQLIEEKLGNNLADTVFLLAGPSQLVKSYRRTLLGLKIKRKNIKSNPFLGRVSRVVKSPLQNKNVPYE